MTRENITVYAIGTTVFVPSTPHKDIEVECPDCLGGHVWTITTPAGTSKDIECPRCNGGKDNWLKPKRHERTLEVSEAAISSICMRASRWESDSDVNRTITYDTSPYIGSLDHSKVYLSREEAQAAGEEMMAKKVEDDSSEWAKARERAQQRAGMDIITALNFEANRKMKGLEHKIDKLRTKMLEAARYPSIDGPKLTSSSFGVGPVITSESLLEWLGGLLDAADIERWAEEEIREAMCDC